MTKPISYLTGFTELEELKSQINTALQEDCSSYDEEVERFWQDRPTSPPTPLQTLFQSQWSDCYMPEKGDGFCGENFISTRHNLLEYSVASNGGYIFTIRDGGQYGYVFQEEIDYLSKVLGALGETHTEVA